MVSALADPFAQFVQPVFYLRESAKSAGEHAVCICENSVINRKTTITIVAFQRNDASIHKNDE